MEWGPSSVGELAAIHSGGTPRTTIPEYWDGGIPWCTPTDVTATRGRHLVATARTITEAGLIASGATLLPKGALLLCTRATVGELKIATMPVATNQGFKSLVCGESVNRGYLYYCLFTLKGQMADLATGSTFLEISKLDVAQLPVPLPPLPEQRAIASVLMDVDDLIGSLEALITKKRAIKQAAMQQLLTGSTRLPGFGGEWETAPLSAIVSMRDSRISPSNLPGWTLCVELEHIGQGSGRLTPRGIGERVSTKYRFKVGDILFGRLRPYLQKWWHADRPGVCSTEIWVLAADTSKVDPAFAYAVVQAGRLNEAANVSYGTHMPRADWNVVSEVQIPLPPLPEQRAVAAVLTDMDDEIVALERRLDKTRALKRGVMQQLLTGAIRLPIPDDMAADESRQ